MTATVKLWGMTCRNCRLNGALRPISAAGFVAQATGSRRASMRSARCCRRSRNFAADLGVAVITVRQEYELLSKEGADS